MSQFTKTIIRVAIDVTSREPFADVFTGKNPEFWNGTDVEFQFAFFKGSGGGTPGTDSDLLDVSDFESVTVTGMPIGRSGSAYFERTASASAINTALTLEDWQNGVDQHLVMRFSAAEMTLPMNGGLTADFWLVIHGTTNTVPVSTDVFGASVLRAVESGVELATGPLQGGNLIPGGATYDGSGHYVLAVTLNKNYAWTKGANDTSVTNGAQTVTVTDTVFVTQGSSITLNGTAGQAVTAVIRTGVFLTADQSDARYMLKAGDTRITSLDDGNTYKVDVRVVDGVPVLSLTAIAGGGNVVTIVGVDDGHTYSLEVKTVDGQPTLQIIP
jgi:hypothetical protein